jgi:hypothetical protein
MHEIVGHEEPGERQMTIRAAFPTLLCASLMLLGGPVVGAAQTVPNAVLHEVTEAMKLLGRNPRPIIRQATAALAGDVTLGTILCPAWLPMVFQGLTECGIAAFATDNIDLSTGRGPVNGKFKVTVQGDNPVDGPELVIVRGTLSGFVDLSPALLNGVPLGSLRGQWSAAGTEGGPLQGRQFGGTVTGTFRLPFRVGVSGPFYLSDRGELIDLLSRDHSRDVPTVKLELTFTRSW